MFLMDGGMAVDASGTILGVEEYQKIKQQYTNTMSVDFSDRLILPGFIDTHVHLPQCGAVGLYGKELLGCVCKLCSNH
jgi:guanine deaminase